MHVHTQYVDEWECGCRHGFYVAHASEAFLSRRTARINGRTCIMASNGKRRKSITCTKSQLGTVPISVKVFVSQQQQHYPPMNLS
ncbi:unnamed protein product [Diplocarpon coronariae]